MKKRRLIAIGLIALLMPHLAIGALPQHDQNEHLGVRSCAASSCHGSASQRNTYSVLQNEYITWSRRDMHSKAYAALKSDQAKRIADNLDLDAAHTAKICLDCHTDYVPRDRRGLQFNLADGVACEACHGGAGQWLGIHISGSSDKRQKAIDAGMYPTDDPEARADLCLSCHLGTKDKFATHKIMGAGHPRLSFDLQKFTDIQPRHYKVDQDYRERKNHVEDTRAWAIGQVKAARQYMTLLQGPHLKQTGIFPELGLFDCHACHHSFKDLRWQANDRTATAPGSIKLNDSSLAMSQIIAGVVQPRLASELLSGIRELHRASQEDIPSIRSAAGKLERQLASLSDALRSEQFGRQRNNQIAQALVKAISDAQFSDYSDAEQATMALDVISGVTGNYRDEVDALYNAVADKEITDASRFDPQLFAAVFRPEGATPVSRSGPVLANRSPARPAAQSSGRSSRPPARPADAAQMGAPTHRIESTALRVRFSPQGDAGVRTALYRGDTVEVVSNEGDWSRVNYRDGAAVNTGWVSSRFLAAIGPDDSAGASQSSRPAASSAQREAAADRQRQRTAAPAATANGQMGTPTHQVDSTALLVRFRPQANAGVKTALYKGDTVEVLDSEGDWSQINYRAEGEVSTGWVASQYLGPISGDTSTASAASGVRPPASSAQSGAATHRVTSTALRVRSRPQANAGVRTALYRGDEVEVVATEGDWSKVNYRDGGDIKSGWVATRFLESFAATPAQQPTARPAPPAPSAAPSSAGSISMGNVSHSVNANALRVRMRPEANSGVRAVLYFGDEVEVLNSVGEWSRVNYQADGEVGRGWVVASFLEPL